MTPETKARQLIDQKLEQAGWVIQAMKQLNLAAGIGVAVREYPTDSGPADYVLFVGRNAVGVIEAKKDSAGENITAVESQTERYASANLKWRKDSTPLRFLFEATGQIIRFTDNADPAPRSREIFHFFKPETLAIWLAQPPLPGGAINSLRRRLAEQMPALPERNLRDCQISAVTGLEKSLALNKPRALVHMATGAGKTFTAITSVYRLLKFGGAKRILFLVDTRNLGKQAHQEFMAYTPPDDGRKFTELYNVQRLASPSIDPHSQVCISTIQRMYSILSGDLFAKGVTLAVDLAQDVDDVVGVAVSFGEDERFRDFFARRENLRFHGGFHGLNHLADLADVDYGAVQLFAGVGGVFFGFTPALFTGLSVAVIDPFFGL
jgi:type I restriction enzyme R subunit